MANETKIFSGSFKGVPIAINSGSIEGGRKAVVKQFPGRDTQSVEDLGLLPRKYSLEIVISDKRKQDYFSYRNALISALESNGSGTLIHPMYGRIEGVVAVSYSLNESFGSFGSSTVSVNFEIDNNTGIPQSSGSVTTQVAAANDGVQAAVNSDVADNFTVTDSFTGNFAAAEDKVAAITDEAASATAFIGESSPDVDAFSALVSGIADNVSALVSDPSALADAISDLFSGVGGLYDSPVALFDAFTGFFGFGETSELIKSDTAGRIERSVNDRILNGAVSASALGYAYLAATRIEYITSRQIDVVAGGLDAQYDAVQQNGSSQAVKDSITDMRVIALEALDLARVDASKIISVRTNPTTTRTLAFTYYGNDDHGEEIADLNGIDDVSFIEGDIEVLTNDA